MVGLRLGSGIELGEGDDVGEEVAPWAAALSDLLLSSHCSSCLHPCSPSRFPCPGFCEGAVVYCSPSCRTSDLPLHFRSAECKLLSLVRSPSFPVSSSTFPSLGGTCDIRAALRLLARHQSLNHISSFLATPECHNGVHFPRLGGLLSNRSILLQTSSSRNNEDDEELWIAKELGKAAKLMHHVLHSVKAISHVQQIDTHNEDCSVVSKNIERQAENFYLNQKNPSEDAFWQEGIYPHVHEWMEGAEFFELTEVHEGIVDNHGGHVDVCEGSALHASKKEEAIDEKLTSLNVVEEMLLVQEVLCQVFTNGVQINTDVWLSDGLLNVQSKDLGTAVYGPSFSWIDHSCKPNAFFNFALRGKDTSQKSTCKAFLHPDMHILGLEDSWGLRSAHLWSERARASEQGSHLFQCYGPRAQLRAIRRIKGDEPVCISYIDLIQPKGIRRQDLWLKYRFHCNCERCQEESLDSVDSILEKLGTDGSPCDIHLLEEWLRDKAECGSREFLENDNSLSCCNILEGAMTELLHQAHYCHFSVESSQWLGENSNYGKHQGPEASPSHQRHLRLHLMHYLCLDIYMTLTSSYKILAFGFIDSSNKGSSTCDAAANSNEASKRREVECSMASAAYALFLAVAVQHLCDLGEPGLMGIASRFWLQNWEALICLLSKLDSFFHVDSMSGMENLLSTIMSEFNFIICCHDNDFICKFKELSVSCQNLKNCVSNKGLLQCSAMALWPFVRSTSPFLSNVETPFDGSSEVFICTNEKQAGLLNVKDHWICYRVVALICAVCSLRHSVKLMNVLHGSGNEVIEAMRSFLCSCFV